MSTSVSTLSGLAYLLTYASLLVYYYAAKRADPLPSPTPAEPSQLDIQGLSILMACLLLSQVGVNTAIMQARCGGAFDKNFGAALLITVIPWFLLFGGLVLLIAACPEIKAPFANVAGYFWIASSANAVLTDLLTDTKVQQKIAGFDGEKERLNMQLAADAILKLCADKSILINEITPLNFQAYWLVLKPLMKQQWRQGEGGGEGGGQSKQETGATLEMKQKLFDAVVSRDNVGEAMWYAYTGTFLCALTNFKLMTHTCQTDVPTMQKNHSEYLAQKQAVQAEQAKNANTVYTL